MTRSLGWERDSDSDLVSEVCSGNRSIYCKQRAHGIKANVSIGCAVALLVKQGSGKV